MLVVSLWTVLKHLEIHFVHFFQISHCLLTQAGEVSPGEVGGGGPATAGVLHYNQYERVTLASHVVTCLGGEVDPRHLPNIPHILAQLLCLGNHWNNKHFLIGLFTCE